MKTVSAAMANRNFSALLREVARGERVLVTSRGKPVAHIVPVEPGADPAHEQARQRLLDHLRQIKPDGLPRTWTRDELYE